MVPRVRIPPSPPFTVTHIDHIAKIAVMLISMKPKVPTSKYKSQEFSPENKQSYLVCGFIALFIALGYSNTLGVPILFDDYATIVENTSIRSLLALRDVLSPPINPGLGWRPFANVTFALSYAISGLEPWAHHVFSILIHIFAGMTLFGVINQTLKSKILSNQFGKDSVFLAGCIALLWSLQPVQTQTVSYISQRTEALMGLLYLLTLYSFIRGTQSEKKGWYALSVTSCVLGVMSKEVIITAPVVVLLYDSIFIAGTFKEALSKRWKFYCALASSWIPFLILLKAIKHQAVGYGIGVTWYTYALTECKAVTTYFRLCLWPHPLIFDRGAHFLHTVSEALPYGVVLLAMLGATIYALIKKPSLGFIGAWFFIVLSPTSSVVPVAEVPIAENRIYLPIAAVLTLFVIGLYAYCSKKILKVILPSLIIACLVSTYIRNNTYQTSISIWTDTLAKEPNNPRALNDLGYMLLTDPKHKAESEKYFIEALRQKPNYSDAHNNLGMLYADDPSKRDEAIAHYAESLKYNVKNAEAHSNYANLASKIPGKEKDAEAHFLMALALKPYSAEFHNDYAILIAKDPAKQSEAIAEYKKSIELKPTYAEAHNNLANLYSSLSGKDIEAIAEYKQAIAYQPDSSFIHFNLGLVYKRNPVMADEALKEFKLALALNPKDTDSQLSVEHCNVAIMLEGRKEIQAAIKEYETALSIYSAFPEAQLRLAGAYEKLGGHDLDVIKHLKTAITLNPDAAEFHLQYADYLNRHPEHHLEAIKAYDQALKLDPKNLAAHINLAKLCAETTEYKDMAIGHYKAALSLNPKIADLHNNLALLYAEFPSTQTEAVSEYTEALKLNPDFAQAHNNFGALLSKMPGKASEAEMHYKKAIALISDYAEAYNNLGNLYGQKSESRIQAITQYESALKLLPQSYAIHFNLAVQLEKDKSTLSDARQHYAEALRLNPLFTPAKEALKRLTE